MTADSKEIDQAMDYAMWLMYAHAVGKTHADRIMGYRPEPPEGDEVQVVGYGGDQ